MLKNRILSLFLLALTIVLGLTSRSDIFAKDSFVQKYVGDALWAMAVFWAIAIVSPKSSTRRLVISTLIFAYLIEVSQFYHAEWIDHLRNYRLGALFLGNEFRWSDIICYTAGVLLAATLNHILGKEIKKETKYELDS